jgi:S-adenosylmethionine hydrolase
MELNKENQHIVMQWNDSYFIADNGILSMLSQKLFLKEWLLLISTIAVQRATGLDVFVLVACHIAKGINVMLEKINSLKQITEFVLRMILIC